MALIMTGMKGWSRTAAPPPPVTFHSFTALFDKSMVSLNWIIDTDETFPDYTVERSIDGKNYSAIGKVLTTGLAGANNSYGFRDLTLPADVRIVYYRLRWLSMGKNITYSKIKLVRVEKETEEMKLFTYPNPVREELKLTLPSAWQSKKVSVGLYNADGRQVEWIEIARSSQTETIKCTSLSKGFYLLQVRCGAEKLEQSIIKD